MIVDFAIEDDPERVIFVRERLMPGGKVDNAQAPHADSDPAFGVDAFIVRAAMRHHPAHPPQDRSVGVRVPVESYDSSDSTHCATPSPDPPVKDILASPFG